MYHLPIAAESYQQFQNWLTGHVQRTWLISKGPFVASSSTLKGTKCVAPGPYSPLLYYLYAGGRPKLQPPRLGASQFLGALHLPLPLRFRGVVQKCNAPGPPIESDSPPHFALVEKIGKLSRVGTSKCNIAGARISYL